MSHGTQKDSMATTSPQPSAQRHAVPLALVRGSAWLRRLENFTPVFRVQSSSGPEEWRHAFSEPFATWEEAAKLMHELHALGCHARVIRETTIREIYEVPNTKATDAEAKP